MLTYLLSKIDEILRTARDIYGVNPFVFNVAPFLYALFFGLPPYRKPFLLALASRMHPGLERRRWLPHAVIAQLIVRLARHLDVVAVLTVDLVEQQAGGCRHR
jgi:hypothetical protein